MVERRWLTVRETGEAYSLHPKTVLALCRQRRIPHTRLPSARGGRGQIRIDRVAFDQQLAEREVLPTTEPVRIDRRRKR